MSKFIKTILPGSFNYDESVASLVDVHSKGVDSAWMKKRAAAGVFKTADITPEKGKSILHIIAMGDADRYGVNRNGDGFLEKAGYITVPEPKRGDGTIYVNCGNLETHDTFVKKAKVYRDHKNKDQDRVWGEVIKSAHNDPMSRVELLIKVKDNEWESDLQKLASGGDIPFSMSCTVPFDICTICGNKAKNRSEYCDHARDHMTELTKSGHQVGVVNDHMVYFDISRVRTPADRIAYGLLKAASGGVMSGSELSEQFILFPPKSDYDLFDGKMSKLAVLRKLAEIEKEIDAIGKSSPICRRAALAFSPDVNTDLSDEDITALQPGLNKVSDILGTMADAKITLSLRDFMRLVMGDNFESVEKDIPEAEEMLPGIFNKLVDMPSNVLSSFDDFDLGDGLISGKARDCVSKLIPTNSLDSEPVQRRITIMIVRKPDSSGVIKTSSFSGFDIDKPATRMAIAYGLYKLSFCAKVGADNKELMELAILQNCAG